MDKIPLEEVMSHKHLGLILSSNLSWDEHIEHICVKANQSLNVLNALKYKLDRSTLEKLYFSFVRSKLEYGSIVFDNCSKHSEELLDSVQYRAAKIVSGAIHRTSHNVVYSELGWERLEVRRRKHRLKIFYKMANNEAPVYLQNIIPAQPEHDYILRHQSNYPLVNARTAMFQNTFLPKTISDWNRLDDDVKLSGSVETFVGKLGKDKASSPKWFCTGERTTNISHARLRMLCSSLNDHLYSLIHVIDSPRCACGHPRENNKHFFLECPLFSDDRTVMVDSLSEIGFRPLISNILFGDENCSEQINITAFTIIQQFIKNTNRFKH